MAAENIRMVGSDMRQGGMEPLYTTLNTKQRTCTFGWTRSGSEGVYTAFDVTRCVYLCARSRDDAAVGVRGRG
jgi:hypothetical protein